MDRDALLSLVYAQLEQDIDNRDYTAIDELLSQLPDSVLLGYLPEQTVSVDI